MRYFAKRALCGALIAPFLLATPVRAESGAPKVASKSAILLDFKNARVLWEKDGFAPMPMASTTKIMTAMIAIENANLSDIVTVSARAARAPEVKMHLIKGEKIMLEHLLYALLLESANDAAVAIAERVGGSVENFCAAMTAKARELGARDTVFETPNGLDAGDHHSTAYDLALITRYALCNEKFMEISNTRDVSFKSDKKTYSMHNKNRLLYGFEGANGVKTGFTTKAGHCFVGAAKRGGMQLISVVLASGWGSAGKEQKWKDTREILEFGFDNFRYYNIIEEKSFAGNFAVERSKTPFVDYYFAEGINVPLTRDEYNNLEVQIEAPELIRAPVTKNEKVGVAKIFISGNQIAEVDLLSAQTAARSDIKTYMEKIINEWLSMGTSATPNMQLPESTPDF